MQLCKIIGRGVTVRMIFSYEREGVNPDIDLLIAFADVFNVSVDFLLGRPNPDTKPYDADVYKRQVYPFTNKISTPEKQKCKIYRLLIINTSASYTMLIKRAVLLRFFR